MQTELREANDSNSFLKAELKRAQAFGRDAAKSAVRLQVLAPKVCVTVGGAGDSTPGVGRGGPGQAAGRRNFRELVLGCVDAEFCN